MANNTTWTPRPLLNVARGGLASATAGGRIHVIGGFSSGFATTLASVEAHQPGNNTWELVAPMLTPRGNPGAAAAGNRIYALGGFPSAEEGLVFRGYAAESRWLSRMSGNRSQMAWSG
jgi:hypothetical protein